MTRSRLELEMQSQLEAAGLVFTTEVRFCPPRRFRSDFAVYASPARLVLVDVHGTGPHGRHGSYGHLESDCEKVTLATLLGFRTILCTAKHVRSGQALAWIEAALGIRPLQPPPVKAPLRRSCAAKRPPKRGRGLPLRVRRAAGLP